MGKYTTSDDPVVDEFWGGVARRQDEINSEVDPDPDFEYEQLRADRMDDELQAIDRYSENNS